MLKLEAKKRRDPQGFTSSTVVVLIACHIHIGLEPGSRGFTLENCHQSLLCKSMRIKVMTQQFILGT